MSLFVDSNYIIFKPPVMSSRLKCCVIFLSTLIVASACYVMYFMLIIDKDHVIEGFNRIRIVLFLSQHLFTLFMLIRLLINAENDDVIKWMFQLSLSNFIICASGEVYVVTHGGRIFGNNILDDFY